MPDKTLVEHYRGEEITEDKLSVVVSAYLKKLEAGEWRNGALTFDIGAAIEANTFCWDLLARGDASERPRRSAVRNAILLSPVKA